MGAGSLPDLPALQDRHGPERQPRALVRPPHPWATVYLSAPIDRPHRRSTGEVKTMTDREALLIIAALIQARAGKDPAINYWLLSQIRTTVNNQLKRTTTS
jgi:hypothetical protein